MAGFDRFSADGWYAEARRSTKLLLPTSSSISQLGQAAAPRTRFSTLACTAQADKPRARLTDNAAVATSVPAQNFLSGDSAFLHIHPDSEGAGLWGVLNQSHQFAESEVQVGSREEKIVTLIGGGWLEASAFCEKSEMVGPIKGQYGAPGSMKYFRRYNSDESCKIICLQCFATIGTAKNSTDALDLEHQHVCSGPHVVRPDQQSTGNFRVIQTSDPAVSGSLLDFAAHLRMPDMALLLVTILLLLYGLPSVIEFAALYWRISAVGIIVFGDVAGCACLATILRMPATGVTLYLALLVCEIGLQSTGALPRPLLPWILDLLPTIAVTGKIATVRSAVLKSSRLTL